jgi:flagellar hook-length control protein FliK
MRKGGEIMPIIISAVTSGIQPELYVGAVARLAEENSADFGAMLETQFGIDFGRGFQGKEAASSRETSDSAVSPETTDVASELNEPTGASTPSDGADGRRSASVGESDKTGKDGETEITDSAGEESKADPDSPAANEWVAALTWGYPEILPSTEPTPPTSAAAPMVNVDESGTQGKIPLFSAGWPDSKLSGSAVAEVTETTETHPGEGTVPVQPDQVDASQSVSMAASTGSFDWERTGGYDAHASLKLAANSEPLENRMTSGITVEQKPQDIRGGQLDSLAAKLAQATTKAESLPGTVSPLQQTPASTTEEAVAGVKSAAAITAVEQAGAAGRIAQSQLQTQTGETKTELGKEFGFSEAEPVSGLTEEQNNFAGLITRDLTTDQTKQALKAQPDPIDGDFQAALSSPQQDAAVPVKEVNEIKEDGPPVTQNELFSQIVAHGKIMASNGHTEMELHLKPDHLGKLKLQISLENQIVTARFVAESEQVKQIIETGLTDLKRALQDNGIQAENLMVATGQPDTDAGSFQQSFFQQSGGAAAHGNFVRRQSFESSPEATDILGKEARTISQSRVDMIA